MLLFQAFAMGVGWTERVTMLGGCSMRYEDSHSVMVRQSIGLGKGPGRSKSVRYRGNAASLYAAPSGYSSPPAA